MLYSCIYYYFYIIKHLPIESYSIAHNNAISFSIYLHCTYQQYITGIVKYVIVVFLAFVNFESIYTCMTRQAICVMLKYSEKIVALLPDAIRELH